MASKFYIQMPPTQTPKQPSSRRSPLTPSSPGVSPPSLTAHNSCASRHDAGVHPARATAILTRMASNGSRRSSDPTSTPQSPEERSSINSDSSDYWHHGSKEAGGYISFPDFEKYCSSSQDNDGYQDERT
ncbi:hypothetical protein GTA08_BOTSDO09147 [Neofusicoccum parvum]|uniref:Uncharacterized protein n=2 Tax=Neofusicoccum parvum TaxID=310453 RepID=R1GKN6_BOTPV|nr:hypothetical protein UCRNP2_6760 [Neofusicoccum parvum UCRNP2]GME42440.1 hypothetical protein GTA08_BOTSDO09147 [Neofusicoccum parvum]GME46167.1 hypothetical protein GTA08_BOTSDO09147 [Neofusicoccum parvum]